MIVFQHEPPVKASGRVFIAVARIKLVWHAQNGALLFTGDKRAVAVICRGNGGEEIFNTDGARIEADELQALINGESA